MAVPQLGRGPVVKGNAAVGVGHVDRDRQRLEQLSPSDHHGFLHEFWPTTLRRRTSAALPTQLSPLTNGVNSTREPRQLRRGPLPLSHTQQKRGLEDRFRGKRPRRDPLNTKNDWRCNRRELCPPARCAGASGLLSADA